MLNKILPNYSDVNLSNKKLKLQISNKIMHDRETTRGLKHYLTLEGHNLPTAPIGLTRSEA